jgi:hypothetical protein
MKRKLNYIAMPLCAIIALTITVTASQQRQPQMIHTTQYRGDVNGDGDVSVADALQVLRHLVGLSSVAGELIPVPTPDSWTWLDMMPIENHEKHLNAATTKISPWNNETVAQEITVHRGFYCYTYGSQSAEFALNSDYNRFIGVLVGTENTGSENPATVMFYDGENLLYTSPLIFSGTAEPVNFNVDVSGVQTLKIVIEVSNTGHARTGIVNARFERNSP